MWGGSLTGRDEFIHPRSNIKVTVWNEFSSIFIYPILFLAFCFYVFFGGGGGYIVKELRPNGLNTVFIVINNSCVCYSATEIRLVIFKA